MSRKTTDSYCQCTLKNNNLTTVSWIPSKFCTVGHNISVKDEKGNWRDWRVESISEPVDAKYIEEHADSWRDYIKNTDI